MDLDYPYLDDTGTLWYDSNGFRTENAGECFICKTLTDRIDINFLTFFCNAPACNDSIHAQLAKNGYESDYDEERFSLSERGRDIE